MNSKSRLKAEYRRLRKNILANIRRYKSQGAHVPVKVPDIPKKITEGSIRRLQKLTPEYIKERSTIIDPRTTEVITVKQKQIRQRKGYYKSTRTDVIEGWVYTVLNNYDKIIRQYPKNAYKVLRPWLDGLLSQYGERKIATMLQDADANGIVIDYKIAYDDELLADYQHRLIEYLPTPEEEKADLHNDVDEYTESWEELE